MAGRKKKCFNLKNGCDSAHWSWERKSTTSMFSNHSWRTVGELHAGSDGVYSRWTRFFLISFFLLPCYLSKTSIRRSVNWSFLPRWKTAFAIATLAWILTWYWNRSWRRFQLFAQDVFTKYKCRFYFDNEMLYIPAAIDKIVCYYPVQSYQRQIIEFTFEQTLREDYRTQRNLAVHTAEVDRLLMPPPPPPPPRTTTPTTVYKFHTQWVFLFIIRQWQLNL